MKQRQESAYQWYSDAKVKEDEEIMVRADSAMAAFIECKLTIDKQPTADVVPVVHGRWEEKEVTDDLGAKVITEWQSCKCSVCGKYLTTPYMYFFTCYAYCPNCGAHMEGAE